MTTLFRNVQQTTNYAKFRPQYPRALYDFIVTRLNCPATVAVDVGCGTGQATMALAHYFDKVIGIDPSAQQLSQIAKQGSHDDDEDDKIKFIVNDSVQGLATLEDASVACITAAQAAHWFDLPAFYAQVNRVLQPGGILALWTYGLVQYENDKVNQMVNHYLYQETLGNYWDHRRDFVEQRYANLPLIEAEGFAPAHRVENEFDIDLECSPTELAGYLRSWSAYNDFCQKNLVAPGSDNDPVQLVQECLRKDDIRVIRGKWPLTLVWSRKEK